MQKDWGAAREGRRYTPWPWPSILRCVFLCVRWSNLDFNRRQVADADVVLMLLRLYELYSSYTIHLQWHECPCAFTYKCALRECLSPTHVPTAVGPDAPANIHNIHKCLGSWACAMHYTLLTAKYPLNEYTTRARVYGTSAVLWRIFFSRCDIEKNICKYVFILLPKWRESKR